ncbi:MAG: LacI family transcriptional regulator [Betaproteobacteria bacterium]|nr:LacI family transcriptional regulator [Betaproteobacteria bacterium]
MKSKLFQRCALLGCALASVLAANGAQAQTFPDKPVHIVVPLAAGGAVDAVARTLGQKLTQQLGQPVIIDNKPGANGNIGAEAVAKSAPDGYTILMAIPAVTTNQSLYAKLPYDTFKDFAPVARLGGAPLILVVGADSPYKTFAELLAALRANPGKFSYGSSGNGSSQHLAGELFKASAKVDALHVPYKGGAPAVTDLIGGQLTFMLTNPLEVQAQIKSGRLKPLGVGGAKRVDWLPGVPTLAESGLAGYEATTWWGTLAPIATPPAVVARLTKEIVAAMNSAEVTEHLKALGAEVATQNGPEFAGFLKTETDKWARIIKSANIKVD